MLLFIGSWKKIVESVGRQDADTRFALEEKPDRYVLRALLSGTLLNGWLVTSEEGSLKLKGESQWQAGDGKRFDYVRSHVLDESFSLPPDADGSKLSAEADGAELTVTIPRRVTETAVVEL